MNATDEASVDLGAVQSDDALLDLIGAGHNAHAFDDASLASLLVAWRRDIDSEPIGVLVGTDKAVRLVRAARKSFVGRVVDAFLRLLGVQR